MGTTTPGGIYALNGSYYHADGSLIPADEAAGLIAARNAALNLQPAESIESPVEPAPVLEAEPTPEPVYMTRAQRKAQAALEAAAESSEQES